MTAALESNNSILAKKSAVSIVIAICCPTVPLKEYTSAKFELKLQELVDSTLFYVCQYPRDIDPHSVGNAKSNISEVAVNDIVPAAGEYLEDTLAAASPDLLRTMIREFAQRMMDAEVEQLCGAGCVELR